MVTSANLSAMTDTHGAESAAPSSSADIAPGRTSPLADDEARLLETLRADSRGTLIERMGIEILEASPRRVSATMPVAGNTQPAGLLHGGASVVLAETLGSIAAQLHAGEGRAAVGIEINATHHRGVRAGTVRGMAEALHLGRTMASYEIVITDEQDRRVCTARLTCMVIDPR